MMGNKGRESFLGLCVKYDLRFIPLSIQIRFPHLSSGFKTFEVYFQDLAVLPFLTTKTAANTHTHTLPGYLIFVEPAVSSRQAHICTISPTDSLQKPEVEKPL